MPAIQKLPTFDTLSSYYAQVHNLAAYIRQCTKDRRGDDDFLLQAPDSVPYRELLSSSLVCLPKVTESPQFQFFEPYDRMKDVIQRAQEHLLVSPKSRPSNIVTLGYKRALLDGKANSRGIINCFVNTIIVALEAPEWEKLLERIGSDAMLHLLTETSIFIKLPNECLCQVAGELLIHVAPPELGRYIMHSSESAIRDLGKRKRDPLEGLGQRKRLKFAALNNLRRVFPKSEINAATISFERRTAGDVLLVRARIFYARPNRAPQSQLLIVGLPAIHVLNQLHPSYFRRMHLVDPDTYRDPDPRDQARKARHLSKYIFPLQYGLSNVFTSQLQAKEHYKQPDFADRENEIQRLGPCKTPKRLKDVLVLLDKMIWRHGKCGYRMLRDKVCPSKIIMAQGTTMDSSIILEMVSEKDSVQHQSRVSHIPNPKEIEHQPRFVDFACSHSEVFRYAAVVTGTVIPKAFWGCQANFQIILGYIKELIANRRYETSTLHYMLRGFMVSECDWLMPPGEGARKQRRVSVSDSLKRRELLEEFIFWYFDSFLFPLLKTTFYITESSAFRNHVLYFRQDDWGKLCQPLIDRFSQNMFREIEKSEAEEILRQRQLGFSFVRFLPKATGVRPIMNLRGRASGKNQYARPLLSVNQILKTTFAILTYEKQNQPDLLGASVFSPNEIYKRLMKFKTELLKDTPPGVLPQLYFVKVDVQACFDSIEQTKLLEILRHVISEDNYMIRKYGQIKSASGKIQRAYIKKAHPEGEHVDFVAYARDLSTVLKHTIFTDQVVYDFQSRAATLKLLEEHIKENIVKMGQRYYQQIVGIPQGSALSTILCSFFFGDLERSHLHIFDDLKSLLLRCIDDYLYVTTSLEKAKRFLDVMNKGHPEYGCIISKGKTMANFEHESIEAADGTELPQKYFPWCGLLIDMSTLSIRADYSRYRGNDLEYSLTVHKGRRPGLAFVHKMLQLAKARSHIIYTDIDLNGVHTVYVNVYQNFIICAMKMHHHLMTWGIDVAKNTKLIRNTIGHTARCTYSTLRQSHSAALRTNGGNFDLQKSSVIWLGMHAFHHVLSKRPGVYGASKLLESFQLSLLRNKPLKHRMSSVVKDGLAGVATVHF